MYLEYYGLHACFYFNSPGLNWDSMLKMTVDLIIICISLLKKNMRGGVSYITHRYSKASNKYIELHKGLPSNYYHIQRC